LAPEIAFSYTLQQPKYKRGKKRALYNIHVKTGRLLIVFNTAQYKQVENFEKLRYTFVNKEY
jgi:hypothetical protein